MPAASTDKLIKGARRWSGQIGASGVSDGSVTTIPLVSSTGLPTDTAVELTIDRVDASGNLTPSKEEIIRGVVSGTNIISAVRGVEGTAQGHSAGAVVEVRLTASMWSRLIDWALLVANQSGKLLQSAVDGIRYAADAGGDDTYSVTLDPVPAAYYAGMEVNFKPTTANTGACTLDVNGLGAKTIKKNVSSDLATGDILAGQMVKVLYDGTNFQLVSDIPVAVDTTGWNAYSTVVPTRASADDPTYVLTFAGVDLTSMLSVGMRVKWTQNATVRYAIITAISFSTNTTLTLYGGTDYDVDDTATFAISGFAFSLMKAPLGFPLDPTKWTVTVISDTTERTQASPVQDTVYNLGSLTGNIPIGVWDVDWKLAGYVAGGTNPRAQFALSTANNSISDTGLAKQFGADGSGADNALYCRKTLVLAAKTAYYLVAKCTNTSASTIRIAPSNGSDAETTIVRAICAYL